MAGLKVAFMGTPDFALAALKALDGSAHEITVVYSQPPRPKGRGHQVQKSPVHDYAETLGIPVLTPLSLKGAEAQQEFAAHGVDVAAVAAYGLLLPKAILDAPTYGCLNIHASLLPRWRGASPIQQAIWQGDPETGITVMQMDEGLDTGAMIAKETAPITPQTTAGSLHDALADIGGRMIVSVLDEIADAQARLPSQAQDEALKTYAPLLKKEDGRIDWSLTAEEIDRQVRALNPWPGVYTDKDGQRFKILTAAPGADRKAQAGEVISADGDVGCGGDTVLRILKIQPAGKQAMGFRAAVNGGYIKPGDVLG